MATKDNKQGASGKNTSDAKNKKEVSGSNHKGKVKSDSSQGHGKSTAKNVKKNMDTEQE